jgi:DNA-binding NtrC family response regulator
MGNVLIIDDCDDIRFSLENIVTREGYAVTGVGLGAQGLALLEDSIVDLVFLDIGLPDYDGTELIRAIRARSPDADIVMLTGNNDAQSAVKSLKAGAVDYLLKPFELIEFKNILHRIMQSRIAGRQALLQGQNAGLDQIIGTSRQIMKLKEEIRTAAGVTAPVLITGETGTGKELVARSIHALQPDRQKKIFVKVDCGTLSSSIIESELFGHEQGAFTDARRQKKGLVELADGGILFLDELGNLPLAMQPRLLRLIEESTFRRVGGLRDIRVNVRIIAATNARLEEAVQRGEFREDIFYRLNVIHLAVPPLRERGGDVLLLADYFRRQMNRELKKQIRGFAPDMEKRFLQHGWPGNIRELKNCIERQAIYCRGEVITSNDPQPRDKAAVIPRQNGGLGTLAQMQQQHIKKVLESTNGNKSLAARILGISRNTLKKRMAE